MKELGTDIKRALTSPPFWVSALVMAGAVTASAGKLLFPSEWPFLESGYHAALLLTALHSDMALFALPILCSIPYTAAFLEEYESGYIKNYLLRCDARGYITGKAIVPSLSGGAALMLGISITWLVLALIFTPNELRGDTSYPAAQILKHTMLYGLSGMLWASLGSLLGALSLSRYMSYAAPFVFYYVLIMLHERYFPQLHIINPKEWILARHEWPGGAAGVALPILLCVTLLCYLCGVVIERRLQL